MVIRVLVAEDHTIVREGIKQLIGMAKDLQVVGEATNGEQLLETLRGTPCEVVLLDISMPGVNGLEAIPRIRALNEPPAILVLSMHDEAQMAARALKIGAAGYATKDSDPALLLTAIRRVAGGGRYIDPDLADRMVFEVGLTDSRPPHALLSEREFSVFERLVQAPTSTRSPNNWRSATRPSVPHKARLMQKLNAHSVADLVRYAMEHRLL
ncbi:putative two-component response regulator [Pseudomonas aeruginosa]|nr:putative two-component response regulator [Pseudomonas aeruginosa]